ncbi:unnamed protein product [Phytophthora fragariaefolia]|uniref:Unnamed protein product n=1 Tax=Phytophthora fragariaefolia TaxID=1490495 RepID=A0A9W6UBN6_9STRA|nr:unnamed protein product [Phytophthora fragariaefolia]
MELIACPTPTADYVYTGLMDWFKRFGVVLQWVSDQGAHLRNHVIERLQRSLGAQRHFTTAYTPWANGTVEVVDRELLRVVKALLSERQLPVRDWSAVLPVVHGALNAKPVDRLDGKSPLTAFTALPGAVQLRSILHPHDPVRATVEWVHEQIVSHLYNVRGALDGLHAELNDASEKRRRAARARHARRQGVQLQKFNKGDFVLAAIATGRSGHKLALIWCGPKRIVRALNDYTFEVQDIVAPFEVSTRHASRLQFYRDAARGREEDLQEQAIYGEGGHLVEALRDCRLSPDTHRREILVKWIGLDDIEASWEPAEVIRQDVPLLFAAFTDAEAGGSLRRQMASALNTDRRRSTAPAAARLPRRRAWAVRPTSDPI